MTRRKLITLLGGLLALPVAQPFVARADRTRRIGLLINLRSDDPEGQKRLMAFVQALHQKFGWIEGSNIHIDLRWASDNADLARRYAEELVALAPDVLLASGTQAVVALQKVTRSVPIVFVNATDPVGGASSAAWHGLGATQLDSSRSNTA
jgi:putative ABC transport system substrate-binding protein